LEDGTPRDPGYQGALQEFVKAGREHIAYEQDVVWPRFSTAVSEADLERLGQPLETAKKVAPTRPHPATPPVGMVQKTMGLGVAVIDRVRDAVTGGGAKNPPDPQPY
jgi:hypothetical protein